MYSRERERGRGREDSREPDVPAALLLKSDGRRWRTLRANLFSQGKRPCLVVDGVRARRWRWWYDQVIPLSELSVARGYLQSVFPFWSPVSPHLTSPRFALPLLASRHALEISPKWVYERGLSRSRHRRSYERLYFSRTQRQPSDTFLRISARGAFPPFN